MYILETKKLTKNFGGLAAVSDVSIAIEENSLVGLIGPNGAGKTTLFNLLTGTYEPSEGQIEFKSGGEMVSIGGRKPHVITNLGVARTFQNIRLFKELTALENIKVGMNSSADYGVFSSIFRTSKFYQVEEDIHQRSMELLKIVGLEDKADVLSKNLPYGEQRKLEIARALATDPKLLFLDEPAAGMNPNETNDLVRLINEIKNDFNLTIILIEHDMGLVMSLCEKIFVMQYGKLIAQGDPETVRNDEKVIAAYLGDA